MKGTGFVVTCCFFLGFLTLAFPAYTTASISSPVAWTPGTGGAQSFQLDLTASSSGNALYIYDWGNEGQNMKVLDDGWLKNQWVWFTNESGHWYAGLTEKAKTLDLGADNLFGFFFGTPSNYYTSFNFYQLEYGYILNESSTGMSVLTTAAPVPIPGAAWLLGAGIAGLVAIRRRQR